MSALTALQLDQVRALVRLESLRAAAYSVASQALDDHVTSLVLTVCLDGDALAASIAYHDQTGFVVSGGDL